jgi:hypothetical protein
MTILFSAGKIVWALPFIGFMIPPALLGYWLAIPSMGMVGAALVNTIILLLTALIALGAVYYLWNDAIPLKTIGKTLFLLSLVLLSFIWQPAQVIPGIYRFFLVCFFILAFFYWGGEFKQSDFLILKDFWGKKFQK